MDDEKGRADIARLFPYFIFAGDFYCQEYLPFRPEDRGAWRYDRLLFQGEIPYICRAAVVAHLPRRRAGRRAVKRSRAAPPHQAACKARTRAAALDGGEVGI